MAKIVTSIILLAIASIPVFAQEQADTLKAQELNEVVVEATMQRTDAKKSTYIPTARQKNASQSGADLLDFLRWNWKGSTVGDSEQALAKNTKESVIFGNDNVIEQALKLIKE